VRRMTAADARDVGELLAAALTAAFHAARLAADELHVDTAAVHPARRCRRVGGALTRVADAEARRRRRRSLSLYCISCKSGTRALREDHGHRVAGGEDAASCWASASPTWCAAS
jgi:ribosomal protein S18 acetylase RimI-like enzyme